MAVANAGEDRIHEYTPTRGATSRSAMQGRSRALASRYGRFLAEELKPFIDMHYRTRPEGEYTGLGGSSLGGLVTLALGAALPGDVHAAGGHVAVGLVGRLRDLPARGESQAQAAAANLAGHRHRGGRLGTRRGLRDRLMAKGWQLGRDLEYHEAEGGGHTRSRLGDADGRRAPLPLPAAPAFQDGGRSGPGAFEESKIRRLRNGEFSQRKHRQRPARSEK